eukprot:maker-scaffold_9-snap-gene-12.45-mRNA-1 protein AED:0.02 eAED:0.02 QI:238/0.66/0.75/1/0.66/0.5/4/18/306
MLLKLSTRSFILTRQRFIPPNKIFFRYLSTRPIPQLRKKTSNSNTIKFKFLALGIGSLTFALRDVQGDELFQKFPRSESVSFQEESKTGTKFPLTLEGYEAQDSVHWLVGHSVRCMLGFCRFEMARAYSFALYLSNEGVLRLKEEKEIGLNFTQDHEKLNEFLFPSPFMEKSADVELAYPSTIMRLVMQRTVDASHIVHGFKTSLDRRVKASKNSSFVSENDQVEIQRFLQFLTERGKWQKNDMLQLLRLPHGCIEVEINGEKDIFLQSEVLSWCLFDAFHGKSGHFQSKGKQEILERTKELVEIS